MADDNKRSCFSSLSNWLKPLRSKTKKTIRTDDLVDTSLIAVCQPRTKVRIKGRITQTTVVVEDTISRLEAEVTDESGKTVLIWTGRDSVAGVQTGKTIKAWGRLSVIKDQLVIFNPKYELMPG